MMSTPGITGIAGEMPLEKRFIGRHIFIRDQMLTGHQLGHAINEEKRVTVRKNFFNISNVQSHGILQYLH